MSAHFRSRSTFSRRLLAILLAAGCASAARGAGPVAAQVHASGVDHRQTRSNWIHGDHRIELLIDGSVEFGEDERSVRALSPGARLVVEEARGGAPTRRMEWRGGAAGPVATYLVDGERRALDAEGRRWIDSLLPEILLQEGINAESRVRRLYGEGGLDRVLAMIERVDGDGVQALYFLTLFDAVRLGPAEAAKAYAAAGREIESDGDLARTLLGTQARLDLDDTRVRSAWFATATAIQSDGDQARVLLSTLQRIDRIHRRAETTAALCRSAAELSSDGDKARVLLGVVDEDLFALSGARQACFRALGTVGSDGDHTRVLLAVLDRHGGERAVALAALRVAAGIESDGDLTRVLLSVPGVRLKEAAVRTEYERALATVESDGDHDRARRYLEDAVS